MRQPVVVDFCCFGSVFVCVGVQVRVAYGTMQSCFGPWALSSGGLATPSSQQPSRLVALQDLNPYFIKQIARSLQEDDLEQKIDLEIKMHEGTTKLLAACRHPSQSLEAAKTLLTSRERMTAYLSELHRRKAAAAAAPKSTSDKASGLQPSKAKVSVADIRMPLIWKDTDHFKNRGDHRRFAVFCLLRIGSEIYDSRMISKVDRSMTDISFDDTIVFSQVPSNFEFQLEVYGHVFQDDLSIASTPHKIKRHINDSLSRSVGRKLAATLKDELAAADVGPKFELVAHATLRLEDVDNNICTHDLCIESHENPCVQLPLFGHFCCRLAAQPEFLTAEQMCGPLKVQTNTSHGVSHNWGVLKGARLELWESSESSRCQEEPELCIPISKETVIDESGTQGLTESQIIIANPGFGDGVVYYVAAKVEDSTAQWCSALRFAVLNHDSWKQAAETLMTVTTPATNRHSLFSGRRKGSLYEQTPLKDSPLPIDQREPPVPVEASPLLRRSRSSSVNSSSSSGGNSAKHFLPNSNEVRASQRFSFRETCV